MGEVAWTDEASRWLERIYEHIAEHDADAAMRTVRGILGKAQLLPAFPSSVSATSDDRNVMFAFFDMGTTGSPTS